jgi:hypothetical protein
MNPALAVGIINGTEVAPRLPLPATESSPMHRLISLAIALAALLIGASSAMADLAPCQTGSSAPVFLPWADLAQYSVVKGGGFESGASGWSWGGQANIVSGDDGHLASAPGSHAVQIPGGGTAKTPWTCVDITTPTLRFLVRRVSGTGNLTVKGQIAGSSGLALTVFNVIAGSGTWQPSPIVIFPSVFTSLLTTGGLNAQFTFTSDPGTTYRIDDVYLDPFKKL